MKILFLSSFYPPLTRGGGELSTHYIARGLAARGHAVTIIANGAEHSTETLDGISIIRLPAGLTDKPLFEKLAAKKAAGIIERAIGDRQFDIIHAHDFRTALALSHLNRANAVVTFRDYAPIAGCTNNFSADGTIEPGCVGWHEALTCHRVAEAAFPRNFARAWQYAYNMPYRSRQLFSFRKQIYISHEQKKVIEARHSLQDIDSTVIYNPIPPEFLNPVAARATEGNIVYVGTVEMYKGVGLLLSAWRNIAQHNPDVHLTVVGEGAQRAQYERQAAVWGLQYRVSFTGKLQWDRLKTIYDQADIVAAPHLWVEPFGRSCAEAMARGAIVIASDAGGAKELIESGKTGWLFERGSQASLEETLERALKMGRLDKREMRQAAQAWVAGHLTIDSIAKQHEEFYSARPADLAVLNFWLDKENLAGKFRTAQGS